LSAGSEDMQMTTLHLTTKRPARLRWSARGLLLALGLALSACQHDQPLTTGITDATPTDYRQRHPIAIREGERTVEVFIGRSRGGLSPSQRADVAAFAHAWRREATGGIILDVPAGPENTQAAHDALGEVRAILAASGVPESAVATRPYQPADPRILANIRLNYPKMTATAGPCGLWPRDLGPAQDRTYNENVPYWNLGCASQRNLAAMVDNPADLVQPRGETPASGGRRTIVLDKYRKGEPTATTSADAGKAKISEIGQ
jgi:pilus assembly protein CpaD